MILRVIRSSGVSKFNLFDCNELRSVESKHVARSSDTRLQVSNFMEGRYEGMCGYIVGNSHHTVTVAHPRAATWPPVARHTTARMRPRT